MGRFAEHGVASVRIFGSSDVANRHAVLADVTDMDAFTSWLASDEGSAAKAADGVLAEGFVVFTPIP